MNHEHIDTWGNLRSATHHPGLESWHRIVQILSSGHPEREQLCAYAEARLRMWPAHIARAVPDGVLLDVLRGSAPPSWASRVCNVLHIEGHHPFSDAMGTSTELARHVRERAHELLSAYQGMAWQSLRLEHVTFDASTFPILLAHLAAQDDLRELALCHNNFGRKHLESIMESGALDQVEHLWLDGNVMGKRAYKLLLGDARWSQRAIRTLSWRVGQLHPSAFARLASTPWFDELERLHLRGNVLTGREFAQWKRAVDGEARLREFDMTWDHARCQIPDFWTWQRFSRLERLHVESCFVGTGALERMTRVRGGVADVSARALQGMLGEDAAWWNTIELLSFHHFTALPEEFETISRIELPPRLRVMKVVGAHADVFKRLVETSWRSREVRFIANQDVWDGGAWRTVSFREAQIP